MTAIQSGQSRTRAPLPWLIIVSGCLIALISDLFVDPEELRTALARIRHRRHDVIVMQVMCCQMCCRTTSLDRSPDVSAVPV